jgi:hypothetical protein
MFSVYGKSLQAAKKTVGKLMMNNKSDISVELEKMNDATQTDKQLIVDKYIDDVFKNMKSKRCTHEFSTPHIAQEAYQLMKNDTANFSDLRIMKKRPKKNAEGNEVMSKATRKPLMEWVPLHEEEQAKAA